MLGEIDDGVQIVGVLRDGETTERAARGTCCFVAVEEEGAMDELTHLTSSLQHSPKSRCNTVCGKIP
jgi:hypothetical protein